MTTPNSKTIAALLGSSSTAGRGQAFDWIGALSRRPGNAHIEFRNFGVGGDLAYNALQRTPQVLACQPQKMVIWIGANDVLAIVFPKVRRLFRLAKRLPQAPSLEWFQANLAGVTRTLRTGSDADIALCSLAPIGEAPGSANPVQAELNRLVRDGSAIIAEVALANGCRYLPLYETMQAALLQEPGRAFCAFDFLPFYRDAFRTVVLRQSADEVARKNGWRFHSDGVHLSSRGGMMVADLVQDFLTGAGRAASNLQRTPS